MNLITNTYKHATSHSQLTHEHSVARLFRLGVRRERIRQTKLLARWAAICALLLGSWVPVDGAWLVRDVDYSDYDTPLYDQIVNRIKARIADHLGTGKNPNDRYFIVPFAYQNRGNDPSFSHSFISVICVLGEGKHASPNGRFRQGPYRGREFETFTISWLPHDFDTNPNLCVFDGFGSRICPTLNKCPLVPGKSFNLEQTLKLARNARSAVGMWGPYEIKKEAFELGVKRLKLLDKGTIRYRADDRLYRNDLIAINCIRAIAGLEELFPKGGFLGTGFRMWGINGTRRILIEYTTRVSVKGLLLDPVNIRKDVYGFVYAPARNAWLIYNPFRNASAYHG